MLLIYLFCEAVFDNAAKTPVYLFIVLLALSQSMDAIVNHPYRINGSLLTQTEKISVGKNEIIFVDKKYKENIEAIDSVLKENNFKKGDYIFTYTDALGLAYVYDCPLPAAGNIWFNPNNDLGNCNTMRLFSDAPHKFRLFFILDSRYPFSKPFIKCLAEMGYDFDNGYYKAGDVSVAFSNDPHGLSIYAPR